MSTSETDPKIGLESDQTFEQGRTLLVLSLVSTLGKKDKERHDMVKNPVLDWGCKKINQSESQA